jgi:hypothetical protein
LFQLGIQNSNPKASDKSVKDSSLSPYEAMKRFGYDKVWEEDLALLKKKGEWLPVRLVAGK